MIEKKCKRLPKNLFNCFTIVKPSDVYVITHKPDGTTIWKKIEGIEGIKY